MAEVVLDFVRTHPEVWPLRADDPALASPVSALGSVWSLFAAALDNEPPAPRVLHTQVWLDERYSTDLAERFKKVFVRLFPEGKVGNTFPIGYSTGDFYQPNPQEVLAVTWLLDLNAHWRGQRQLLLLPTGSDRARRYLRTLVRRAPLELRSFLVISGDSITINTVYRDRDIAWNVLDLPVPMIFFSHRNPTSRNAGFAPEKEGGATLSATATDVLLLNRDILEALILAGLRESRSAWDTDRIHTQLRHMHWRKGQVAGVPAPGPPDADAGLPLFDKDGNRNARTGEHIVWVQPLFESNAPLPKATISVWRLLQDPGLDNRWQQVETLRVSYEPTGAR
jgi:hypothetical protein